MSLDSVVDQYQLVTAGTFWLRKTHLINVNVTICESPSDSLKRDSTVKCQILSALHSFNRLTLLSGSLLVLALATTATCALNRRA